MIGWLILIYMMIGIILVTAEARRDIIIENCSFLEVFFLWWIALIIFSINKIIRSLKKRKNEKSKKLK